MLKIKFKKGLPNAFQAVKQIQMVDQQYIVWGGAGLLVPFFIPASDRLVKQKLVLYGQPL